VSALIQLARDQQGATDEKIAKWTISCTISDQFTPLHLASFKGNMDAVHALMAN